MVTSGHIELAMLIGHVVGFLRRVNRFLNIDLWSERASSDGEKTSYRTKLTNSGAKQLSHQSYLFNFLDLTRTDRPENIERETELIPRTDCD